VPRPTLFQLLDHSCQMTRHCGGYRSDPQPTQNTWIKSLSIDPKEFIDLNCALVLLAAAQISFHNYQPKQICCEFFLMNKHQIIWFQIWFEINLWQSTHTPRFHWPLCNSAWYSGWYHTFSWYALFETMSPLVACWPNTEALVTPLAICANMMSSWKKHTKKKQQLSV
jgi:hypothetical protein